MMYLFNYYIPYLYFIRLGFVEIKIWIFSEGAKENINLVNLKTKKPRKSLRQIIPVYLDNN